MTSLANKRKFEFFRMFADNEIIIEDGGDKLQLTGHENIVIKNKIQWHFLVAIQYE